MVTPTHQPQRTLNTKRAHGLMAPATGPEH